MVHLVMFLLCVLAILIIFPLLRFYLKSRYDSRIKKLSIQIVEGLENGQISGVEYAAKLTFPVCSIKTVQSLQADFDRLQEINETTVNGYYIIKGVFKVSGGNYLVIADTLTDQTPPVGRLERGRYYVKDANTLYTSHIYITQLESSISCFSVKPVSQLHKAHNEDLGRYLLALIFDDEYQFAFQSERGIY